MGCIADFYKPLWEQLRAVCKEMTVEAIGKGFSTETIADNFHQKLRPAVLQGAVELRAKASDHWPSLHHTRDIENKMLAHLASNIQFCMSETDSPQDALTPEASHPSQLKGITKMGMVQSRSKKKR